jgi:hypothetical protein
LARSSPGPIARTLRGCCLPLLVVSAALAARSASAASAAELIAWDAPEPCPGALEVYARASSLLGYEPETLGKLSRVRGSVVRTTQGFRLVLEAFEAGRHSSRLFEAASCDELGDAAALAIALAVAPGMSPVSVASEAAAAPAPASTADTAADAAPVALAPASSDAWHTRGFAGAAAVLEYGALPALAPGVAVEGGVRVGPLALGGYAVLLGSERRRVAPDQSVQFDLLFAGVRACYTLLAARPRLEGCAAFEAGRFSAQGLDLAGARAPRDLWLAAGAGLGLQWPLSDVFGVESRLEPALPLLRKEYTVNETDAVHAPARGSLRLYLGLVLLAG